MLKKLKKYSKQLLYIIVFVIIIVSISIFNYVRYRNVFDTVDDINLNYINVATIDGEVFPEDFPYRHDPHRWNHPPIRIIRNSYHFVSGKTILAQMYLERMPTNSVLIDYKVLEQIISLLGTVDIRPRIFSESIDLDEYPRARVILVFYTPTGINYNEYNFNAFQFQHRYLTIIRAVYGLDYDIGLFVPKTNTIAGVIHENNRMYIVSDESLETMREIVYLITGFRR